MQSGRLSFAALTALVTAMAGTPAAAQYYDGCCGAVAAAPVSCCTPIQPVQTTCYQTIPVTTYARERQTVEVPTYETAYEEREVTVYRPVTTAREIDQPYTTYQNVTEIQTVNRDMGRWVTRYHPVAKCAPCQVDPRPGVIGWMNRTGYSMRTAFMPNYTTSRQFVPSMVTCQVPVTRQVAVQATRKVTIHETKMVAERKSERIPVQKLVMKKQEITVMRPQTAYRTVPIGTAMAYGPFIGGSQMAYGYPVIDGATTRSALSPQPDSNFDRSAFKEDTNSGSDSTYKRAENTDDAIQGSSFENSTPLRDDSEPELREFPPSARRNSDKPVIPAVLRKESAAATAATSSSKSSGWHASRKSNERSLSQSNTDRPSISMADSHREK